MFYAALSVLSFISVIWIGIDIRSHGAATLWQASVLGLAIIVLFIATYYTRETLKHRS